MINVENKNAKEILKGSISLELKATKTIEEFCRDHFDNYNSEQFEAIAIRFYFGQENMVTLYALDKLKQTGITFNYNKLPVKKFKSSQLSIIEALQYIDELNFTLSIGNYPLEDMGVINK